MPVHAKDAETFTRTEQIRSRKPRYDPISETLPNPRTPTTRCETSVGGKKKKKNIAAAALRRLGCATAAEVSEPVPVPAVRASAGWTGNKVRKKKLTSCRKVAVAASGSPSSSSSPPVGPDVWCGRGSGFDATADMTVSVDCVLSPRRPSPPLTPGSGSGREKIDSERVIQRERPSCILRRTVTPLDLDSPYESTHPGLDPFGARRHHHVFHPSPKGLAEIMLFRSSLPMEERLDLHDHYQEWRLDIEDMSYEELLELGDQIGYVNTGLREDEIGCCLRKSRVPIFDDLSLHLPEVESKCSICQEEYEAEDEMGMLECGHGYHTNCIKQWLVRKSTCPVCKSSATAAAW